MFSEFKISQLRSSIPYGELKSEFDSRRGQYYGV